MTTSRFVWEPGDVVFDTEKATAHDVSDEARDNKGEWTVGGAISPHEQPPEDAHGAAGERPANPDATRMSGLSPEMLTKVADVLSKRGYTAEDLRTNIGHLWDRMETESPETIQQGKDWYAHAQDAIAGHAADAGVDKRTAIAATAALSPQNEWGQNVAEAGFLMDTFKADPAITLTGPERADLMKRGDAAGAAQLREAGPGIRFSELSPQAAAWATLILSKRVSLASEVANPKGNFPKVGWSCGTRMVARAIGILRTPPDQADQGIDTLLRGHKVRSFFNNITDPYDARGRGDVTVDTHAMSAAILTRMESSSPEYKALAGSPSSKSDNARGAYSAFADGFRDLAKSKGLAPNQAQAALWLFWQKVRFEYPNLHPDQESQGDRNRKAGRYGVQAGDAGTLTEHSGLTRRSAG